MTDKNTALAIRTAIAMTKAASEIVGDDAHALVALQAYGMAAGFYIGAAIQAGETSNIEAMTLVLMKQVFSSAEDYLRKVGIEPRPLP